MRKISEVVEKHFSGYSFIAGILLTLIFFIFLQTVSFTRKSNAFLQTSHASSSGHYTFAQLWNQYSGILNGGEAEMESDVSQDPANPQIILHGDRSKPLVALTFDAEMTEGMRNNLLFGGVKSSYDKNIIDILHQTQTKATFFLTGMWIQLYPQEARELGSDPLFELGSHSYADTSFAGECFGLKQINNKQGLEDIETTQKLLRDVAGVENHYFRFPGGCFDGASVSMVTQTAGLQIIHWDAAGEDGFNQDSASIVTQVMQKAQNGSIILLHLNGGPTAPKTAEALPQIISKLREKGYEFVTVSELLQE